MKVLQTETKYSFHVTRHVINNRSLPLAEEENDMRWWACFLMAYWWTNLWFFYYVLLNRNTTIAKLGRRGLSQLPTYRLRTPVMETLANGWLHWASVKSELIRNLTPVNATGVGSAELLLDIFGNPFRSCFSFKQNHFLCASRRRPSFVCTSEEQRRGRAVFPPAGVRDSAAGLVPCGGLSPRSTPLLSNQLINNTACHNDNKVNSIGWPTATLSPKAARGHIWCLRWPPR